MILGSEDAGPGRVRAGELVGLALLLALSAFLMHTYFVPNTGGTDANAYHVASRLVQLHGRYYQVPDDPLQFVGKMWVVNERGEFYPKYPPLYPGLAGVAMRLFGDGAGLLINPICAVLTVLGAFVACRVLFPGWAALLGALTLGFNPVLSSLAVDQVSHSASIAALTWSFAAFFLATRAEEARRPAWLAAAGFLIGYAVGVRYTNVLLVLPVLLWFLLRWREQRWRDRLAWAAGFAVPCLFIAAYHTVAFGLPWRTGYSLTAEQDAFTLPQLFTNAKLYLGRLPTHGLGPLLVLTLLGYLALWRGRAREGLLFTAWVVPQGLLSMSYYFAPDHHPVSYMRFLLPLWLPATLLALDFAVRLGRRLEGGKRRLLVGGLFVLQGAWGLAFTVDQVEQRFAFNELQQRKLEFLRANVPAGSAILGPLWNLEALDYDQAYRLYDSQLADPDLMRGILERSLADPHMQASRWAPIHEQLFGRGEEGYRAELRALVQRHLDEGRGFYLVGSDHVPGLLEATLPGVFERTEVAHLPALVPASKLVRTPRVPASSPLCLSTTIWRLVPAGDRAAD